MHFTEHCSDELSSSAKEYWKRDLLELNKYTWNEEKILNSASQKDEISLGWTSQISWGSMI